MKIIGRHKWLAGCTITESHDEVKSTTKAYRRFTATVRGWRNFLIYEGLCFNGIAGAITDKVEEIRDRIDLNDEAVFTENHQISQPESI